MQKDTKVLQLHFAKIAILVIFNVKGLSQKRGAISKRRAISNGFYFKKPKLATLKKSKVATLLTVEIYKCISYRLTPFNYVSMLFLIKRPLHY